MKRVLLIASALCIGIAAFVINTNPGITQVQTAANVATGQARPVPEASAVDQDAPYTEACAREGLSESACVGRLIWYKATGGNDRFHTYTFQQRIGVLVDWFRVLRSDQRDDRFAAWGIINDPACCKPGDPDCPAKSAEETYGFDWCPGDDVLLKYVGKQGYVDPACGLKDAPLDPQDAHTKGGTIDQRQSACDLKFGTSTGALGLRKFPNPRFEAQKWKQLNGGSLANWEGFRKQMIKATGIPSDERVSKLADAAYEPPFLIGTACGSCHIAFDPLNPPKDPAHPKWENIKGLVGNQYSRMSELLGSGMPKTSIEWQMFTHARPGVTDTSAISHDQVNNPGTMNSIINLGQRPLFAGEVVTKWRKADTCGGEKDEDKCWCEPGRDNKCWARSTRSDDKTLGVDGVYHEGVHHILKGGEDSIGAHEAIQRVYFNIGSCAEACWVNHLTDFRQVDPAQRGFGQTSFRIGQCRRDCPHFRAIEDRLANVLDFFVSAEGDETDLYVARDRERKREAKDGKAPDYTRQDLIADLDREFGPDAVRRGRVLFAENCARCHSSLPDTPADSFKTRDFYAVAEDHPRKVRKDFLGNDAPTPANEVGTFRCRALHSNHVAGHLYSEYGSETLRSRPLVAGIQERNENKDNGRGYYRNISLLNVWATAPFMHNNAIGPEVCGKPKNAENDFFRSRYVDASGKLVDPQPQCTVYDPSVAGRFDLYKKSMQELLNPKERGIKQTLTDYDVVVDIGLRTWDGKTEKALIGTGVVVLPKGSSAGLLNGFEHKRFIDDLFLAKRDPARLEAAGKKEIIAELQAIADDVQKNPARFVDVLKERSAFIQKYYETCTQTVENDGHRFGEGLPEADKKALTAFLATL